MVEHASGWRCPYCNQIATLQQSNISEDIHFFDNRNKDGFLGLCTFVIVCPNSSCREYTITAVLHHAVRNTGLHESNKIAEPIITWKLKPQSSAKPFPEYIPLAIRQDYEQACLIASPSAKAAATLARRALQGMIRDFWGIRKPNLFEEVKALEDRTDPQTWQAIDAVRSIGNIGAHMEKDIGLIIDVDPGEAELLIRLLEVLLEEWYIRRQERAMHMQKIIDVAQEKQIAREQGA